MPLVSRTVQARRDYLHIWQYIAFDSLSAADRVVDALDEAAQMLANSPGIGRERDELSKGLRSFPVGKYMLFYRRRKSGIQLVRVLHGARNLKRIFRKQ